MKFQINWPGFALYKNAFKLCIGALFFTIYPCKPWTSIASSPRTNVSAIYKLHLKRFFEISFRKLRHTMLRVNSPLVTSGEISSPIHVINFHTPNLTSQGLWFGWPKTQNRRTYMRNIVLNKRSCFNVSYSINTSINLARIHIFLYGIFSEMK